MSVLYSLGVVFCGASLYAFFVPQEAALGCLLVISSALFIVFAVFIQNAPLIIARIAEHMKSNITVTNYGKQGDVIVAQAINNSFNEAERAKVGEDLKGKVLQLHRDIESLCRQLSPEEQETIARDLQSFSKEILSAKPRKAWYELSANGIIEAAKAVGGIAKPVVDGVRAVLAAISTPT